MQRIGIFGGTFNPVHSEHVEIAERAVKELSLDKLYIMPSHISPHKTRTPASVEDRINMLKLAFEGLKNIEISTYEVDNGGTSYTYLTVEHFKREYPNAQIFFICGGDMLVNFKSWKNPQKILDNCTLAVFEREGFFADFKKEQEYFIQTFGKEFVKLNYIGKDYSSTRLRVYTELGLDLEGQIPSSVIEYIKSKNLYSNALCDFVKKNLTEKRKVHTAEVMVTALSKCKELGLEENKVYTACLLHDCAKYLNIEDYKECSLPEGLPKPVVHAFLGAFVAEKVLKIVDEEILDAIRYHTSGKANMSLLGKLVFVADMVEPNRDYEGVEKLRELYLTDFEKCFIECLKEEMIHLINKKSQIFIETLNAYDYYVNKKEGK